MARKLQYYENVALNPAETRDKIDPKVLFGRKGKVYIEIGSGKGTFLIRQARLQPETDFIGVEWANKYYRHSVDRTGRWNLNNVRIIRTEAAKFIRDHLSAESIDCFHIYFPDPWPKKKHHKRRFIKPENLLFMTRALKLNGTIRIATDHRGYFDHICQSTAACSRFLKETDFVPAAGTEEGELVGTNFERKYIREGRDIYKIAVRKFHQQ